MSPPAVLSACCVAACLLLQQRMVCACLKVLAGHMNSFICKVYLPLRNSGTTLTTSASSLQSLVTPSRTCGSHIWKESDFGPNIHEH